MINKFVYILFISFPLIINYLVYIIYGDVIGLLFLGIYICVYRPFIDSKRLYELGEINRTEYNKWMIPFYKSYWFTITHFKKLYLS